jgi:Holliday junction resolvasome RuvABC ATP-dependent DNA helicase subunit
MANLEEVYRLSGIPTYTFVQPDRYDEIRVSVRTPGRCLVLEGPSGIGKTTTITKVLADLGISAQVVSLSARNQADLEYIVELPSLGDLGTVIVDDFHRLDDATKARLSDFMKVLADNEDASSKLILIGINKAGQQLVKFAHDLGLRVDVFKLETNSDEQIEKLVTQGETALNVTLPDKEAIARHAQGSFQIAQLLCHKLCVLDHVTETSSTERVITTSLNVAIEDVMNDLARQVKEAAVTFARGSKIRREGRAPYCTFSVGFPKRTNGPSTCQRRSMSTQT